MNTQGTNGDSVTVGLPKSLLRSLHALRMRHGYKSAAGQHVSNIFELAKIPKPPAHLLQRQMEGLQRALAAGEPA